MNRSSAAHRPTPPPCRKQWKGEPITIKEAASVAQLLPPETVRAAAEQAEQNDEPIDYATLLSLAPFMDNETLDRLADKAMLDDFAKVRSLAPFLSETKLNEIVLGLDPKADWAYIVSLAPFLPEETLDRLVRDADGALSFDHVVSLAPFLSSQTLDEMADNIVVSDAKKLKALAPFLSQKTLDRIAGQLLDGGASGGKLVSLAPFLSKDTIRKIADRLMGEKGYGELSKLWPFL